MFFEAKPEKLNLYERMEPLVVDTGEDMTISAHPRHIEAVGRMIGRTIRIIEPISNEGEIPRPFVYVEPPIDEFMLTKPA